MQSSWVRLQKLSKRGRIMRWYRRHQIKKSLYANYLESLEKVFKNGVPE